VHQVEGCEAVGGEGKGGINIIRTDIEHRCDLKGFRPLREIHIHTSPTNLGL
jgi:hypothetical protein